MLKFPETNMTRPPTGQADPNLRQRALHILDHRRTPKTPGTAIIFRRTFTT